MYRKLFIYFQKKFMDESVKREGLWGFEELG
jgi:hypothetical protein